MEHYVDCDELVSFDGSFDIGATSTSYGDKAYSEKDAKKRLGKEVDRLGKIQRRLYADDRHSILCVFQAMDAAGKDSTIRAVFSGVNPAGCQVSSYKSPSKEELDHDFLWRSACDLPERGRIGIFNRSYYEEVLAVRVHPEYLGGQRLPRRPSGDKIWTERLRSIRDHERHLAQNGTVVVKFFLNVGLDEQRERFLARIRDPKRRWKFNGRDVEERAHWPAYQAAYEEALRATSAPWAPWYVIPADDKPNMRLRVAQVLRKTLSDLDLEYPSFDGKDLSELAAYEKQLLDE